MSNPFKSEKPFSPLVHISLIILLAVAVIGLFSFTVWYVIDNDLLGLDKESTQTTESMVEKEDLSKEKEAENAEIDSEVKSMDAVMDSTDDDSYADSQLNDKILGL